MQPVKTENSNFTYTGPTPDIEDLPCELVNEHVGGCKAVNTYSVWELTDEEREKIALGANIKLGIYGKHPIPPVSVDLTDEQRLTWRADADKAYTEGKAAAREGKGFASNPYLNAMGEIPDGMDSLAEEWDQGWQKGNEMVSVIVAPVEDFGEEEYAG